MPSTKILSSAAILLAFLVCLNPAARAQSPLEYKLLATSRTSTMQKELDEAAAVGFRFVGGINYLFADVPMDVFLEIAPGLDLVESTEFFMNGGLGIRYWF